MPSLTRRVAAEAVGTFALVFFGAAAVVMTGFPGANLGLLGVATAHGLILAVAVSAAMNISGGHINPAVTIAFLVTRRIDARSAAAYIVAQLGAAVLAGLLLQLLWPASAAADTSLGTPVIGGSITLGAAIGIEAVLGFFLMSSIYGTVAAPEAPKVGGFGVGLTLLVLILVAGPLTGAAVNPARAFGPALISGLWVGQIAYWIGPIVGCILAALFWEFVVLGRRKPETA